MMKLLRVFSKWFKRAPKKIRVADTTNEQPILDQLPEPLKKEELIEQASSSQFIRRRGKIHVQVGLDFGTSSTKIAFSQVGGRGRRVVAILFDHELPHYPSFCLPSVAAFDRSGKLLLGVEAARFLADKPWDSGLRRLKVIVAGKYDNSFDDHVSMANYKEYLTQCSFANSECEPECLTAVFLAFAIRQARLAIHAHYRGYEIDTAFNICTPIDHIQNNIVRNIFETILATAEAAEKEWKGDSDCNNLLEIVKEKRKNMQCHSKDPAIRVFSVPEAVAEIASYLVSLQVRNGLHAVIDFGAGTTDFSIFYLENVRTSDENKYWYAARNLPRGAQRIERIVSKYLENVTDLQVLRAVTDINNLSEKIKLEIKQELKGLWEDSHIVWGQAYSHRRKQSEWERNKVHVLVCGGGAKSPFIQDIFSKSWMEGWGPYQVFQLPIPDDYDSLDGVAPFDRMSVAYGLCQPLPALGKFILPNDAPDHTPPRLPIREMPEWDDRIPTRGWTG